MAAHQAPPSLGQEDPLEEGMATHSSILAWIIPWTEEPGGLQSMESQSDTTEQLYNKTKLKKPLAGSHFISVTLEYLK